MGLAYLKTIKSIHFSLKKFEQGGIIMKVIVMALIIAMFLLSVVIVRLCKRIEQLKLKCHLLTQIINSGEKENEKTNKL